LSLNAHDISKLHHIIALAQKLIADGLKNRGVGRTKARKGGKRRRRSGKELVRFRKMLKAERKKGVSVAELAQKHGISSAYIYMIP